MVPWDQILNILALRPNAGPTQTHAGYRCTPHDFLVHVDHVFFDDKFFLFRSILRRCAVTFHPNLPSVSRVLKKHWEVMVSQSNRLKRCFPKPPLVAYRRGKNLGDHLCRAKISTKRKSTRLKNGSVPCRQGCQLCWHIETATTHEDKRTGQVWGIHAPINCKTDNEILRWVFQLCIHLALLLTL